MRRRWLVIGSKELVQFDASLDAELDRFLPDAVADRRGSTAQLMTLRYPHCLKALRECGQEQREGSVVSIADNGTPPSARTCYEGEAMNPCFQPH
jgi:hypothetical protein